MLCAICKESFKKALPILQHGISTGISHLSLRSFNRSVMEGCFVCQQIWAHIACQPEEDEKWLENALSNTVSSGLEVAPRGDRMIYYEVQDYADNFGYPRRPGQCEYGMSYLQVSVGSKTFENPEVPLFVFSPARNDPCIPAVTAESTSTADAENLWCYWFRTCRDSHDACKKQELGLARLPPERLIEILKVGDKLYWRLTFGSNIKNSSYVTLSHCWGNSDHIQLEKDSKGSIARFEEKQKVSELPQTYQDAMRVALSLGVPYIWIDSLCIIQNDKKDWENQSSLMGDIYHNACCNIAASWGADGTTGCFSTRPSNTKPDMSTTFSVLRGGEREDYSVHNQDAYRSDIMHAPLNGRGWVVQERYLARRQLSFAKSQVYWECLEASASEDFPTGIPKHMQEANQEKMTWAKPSLNSIGKIELRSIWSRLIEFYSGCALKHSTDKTVALAGLASAMKTVTQDCYLAGLWEKDIESQLLWEANRQSQRYHSNVRDYIAPSWSWMSVNGSVEYDSRYGAQHTDPNFSYHKTCTFTNYLDASVEYKSLGMMHTILSGTLKLRGLAIRAVATRAENPKEIIPQYKLRLVDDIKPTKSFFTRPIVVAISWDENLVSKQFDPQEQQRLEKEQAQSKKKKGEIEEEPAQHLLFMFVSPYYLYKGQGLVLKMLPEKQPGEETYCRLGVFSTSSLDGENSFDPGAVVKERLGAKQITQYQHGWTILAQEDINLEDERLGDLVHTVTII
ncbi:heterokaryon incompatibility protein-domain-containing protein [Durotheca rogersii]|uniref:heterokaryon incompatibility protein-domain-containing protein n=1 Tax=Durotheca rogersii TaxID=419775 RepID=UPI002220FB5B|nr:heterokaryon incompatibility protein-domain-containing protein [Durotheca rogersii]KAI5860765.1 heterokaryon incompatibility protein-domain-containing protein [Durotheca rogersii]